MSPYRCLSPSRSPLNEDVFTMPQGYENQTTTPDIVQLSERIHRLLVQPVHSSGSQGSSSLGSSGSRGSRRSHQQHLSASATSSSDSNGPAMEDAAAIALHKPVSHKRRTGPRGPDQRFSVVYMFGMSVDPLYVRVLVQLTLFCLKKHFKLMFC